MQKWADVKLGGHVVVGDLGALAALLLAPLAALHAADAKQHERGGLGQ